MNSFIIAGIILLTFVLFILGSQKRFFLSPALVGCFFWSLACFISVVRMDDRTQDFSTIVTPSYIISFAIVTVLGFTLSRLFSIGKACPKLDIEQLVLLRKKYNYILILCFISGLIRMVYTFSQGGIVSLVNYREASLLLSSSSNPFIVNFIRVSGHLSVLGTFYILICAYIDGYTIIKPASFLKNFVMYGMIVASQGGRTFTMVYLLSYFFAYIFGHIHSGKKYTKKNIRIIFGCLVVPILYFSVIGSFRNTSEDELQESSISRTRSVLSAFYYITEGVHVTDKAMQFVNASNTYDMGRDTFTSYKGKTYSQFRESLNGTPDWCNVDSIVVQMYCDFGRNGSLIVWMVICIIGEFFFNKLIRNGSILSFFMSYAIVYIFLYSTIGNPIPAAFRIMVEWIIILQIFSSKLMLKSRNKARYK